MARTKSLLVVLLWLFLSLSLVACRSEQATTVAPDALSDLATMDELQVRFNADTGTPRLLLILAPT